MKQKYIGNKKGTFLLTIIVLLITACEPLDKIPPGNLDPETYFEKQQDALNVLTSAYAAQYGQTQRYYLKAWTVLNDIGSDDMGDGFGGMAPRRELDRFKFDPNFDDFAYVWWHAYTQVNRASLVVEKTKDMPDNVFDSPEMKNRILGEARFLRAVGYFNIIRLYGDAIFYGDSYVSDPVGATGLSRTKVSVIYDFIIGDLLFAEEHLWNRDKMEKGRATKGAAQACLAKVYLTRAGWRLDASTNTMVQGDASNWAEAAKWSKKLIDENKYDLMDNYRHVFPAHANDYDKYENNKEHIYFVNCTLADHNWETLLYWGPKLADEGGAYSSFVGEVELTSSFEPDDLRVETTLLTYVIDEYEEERKLDESEADFWWPGMNIPHVGKFLPDEEDYEFPPKGNPSGTNYPIFRFSEVLLILAEADNEAKGLPTPDAIEAFNRVRRRAGLSEWPNVKDLNGDLYTNDQDGFRQAVRQERRWELCFEAKRLFDLRRWGILVDVFKERGALPDATVHDQIRAQNIEEKHNLYPIPYDDIQVNPNLTQNPGY